jgi:hypothetical protein
MKRIIYENMIIYRIGERMKQTAENTTELKCEKGDALKMILNCLNIVSCLIC